MNRSPHAPLRILISSLFVLAPTATLGADAMTIAPGRYAVVSQMVLPHLDEMRRTSEQQDACIAEGDIANFFPVFLQPAFIGCTLQHAGADAESVNYVLVCNAVNGASGNARLSTRGDAIRGELNAKMGGKNMTFSQYITATLQGPCALP